MSGKPTQELARFFLNGFYGHELPVAKTSARHPSRSSDLITVAPAVDSTVLLTERLLLTMERSRETGYSCTWLQLASGSNRLIAAAVSVVVFPKSF
jgi:hypothetical protein